MPRYYRKVIKIRAEDSPNVRLALAQLAAGKKPTNEILVPGVLTWEDYQKRRDTWDPVRQCVGLDAEFWEGADQLLFPPDWLNRAEDLARKLRGRKRIAKAIGIDPAEGGDKTAMAVVDEFGLVELVSKKTPDTSIVTSEAIAFMRKHQVPPEKVMFDAGGGGKQHADRLRQMGFKVKTVRFGEALSLDPRRVKYQVEVRLDIKEDKYAYMNRRAEMYGELSLAMDPSLSDIGWAFSAEDSEGLELRRQLALMPRLLDVEGRMKMLPKNKRAPDSKEKTLCELLGCSPDQADAVVVAHYSYRHKGFRTHAGVA